MRSQTDPIIAEVRAIRQAYAARFNYDVDAIFNDMRARQAASEGRQYVRDPAVGEASKTEKAMTNTQESRNAVNLMNMYAGCMEEVKRRASVIEGFLRRELTARYLQTTAECIGLQLRKILELIALASMVANESEYGRHRKNFHRGWNGKRILDTLQRANPQFYPVPTTQVLDPRTGKVVETREIQSGFLTKNDYVRLYDACGIVLHAQNPFSKRAQDPRAFLDDAPAWIEKIRVLLNHHAIQLFEQDRQIWVSMEAESDGKVHACEFQRVSDLRVSRRSPEPDP